MSVSVVIVGRRRRRKRHIFVSLVLAGALIALAITALMVGNTFYSFAEVMQVILGETVPGASFAVGELRLPRTALAILAGLAFGVAGICFQVLLRNPLASPDIIGVTQGASAAAVVLITVFQLSGLIVSTGALIGALAAAGLIYLLAYRSGFSGTRLILIGIGIAAMLQSVVAYSLSRASQWDIQTAMRWLTGSLNNASWDDVLPVLLASVVIWPFLVLRASALTKLQLGDDSAAGLGVRVNSTRLTYIIGAVCLLAVATAATGPIVFVAFMSGPIAARLVGPGANLLAPSALVGALLVLGGDLVGQFAFDTRYPVGVITGVLGAPYLIYLLVRTNQSGGSL
ncbi:iron chelate uptake ABC transporter family permease subunit [uncultured Gulosibacter sp.]|uniref:FecCD family ABC transporter permease n=1 Tax=uncultured Gulosibacter sp. TaxID=1339167 RepID=UPI002889EC43|nr:iron chelate uptake ABC transporter family permease subunit [uncultured Gulosibacter sp.]